jgi:Holliday junction resolvase-like predicted endonuclease
VEIDIVALDVVHDEIVFVEVKTRRSVSMEHPSGGVSWQQRRQRHSGALKYLRQKGLEKPYRFDIIALWPGRLEHLINITL